MYIFKNAFRNVFRNRGKNILIGIIITVITVCTCMGLAIYKAGTNLVATYKETNPLAVRFNLDMSTLRNASDDEKNDFSSLTVEDIQNYADSDLVKDYYYTLEASVSSTTIEAVSDNERPNAADEENNEVEEREFGKGQMEGNIGDFRITAYSNFAYFSDFTNGDKKIVEGMMVTGSSDEDEIVISKDLADENELSVGDSITLCLATDEDTTFTFEIIGIYQDSSSSDASNFMTMNALNSSNQLFANVESLQKILDAMGEDDTKLVASNGLSAEFYLTSNDQVDNFEEEVREKGLSDYYTVSTNENEILETLQPIQNISTFSFHFLIVILVIGIVVLAIINFLNIRDRKYEIGVLRAIGMSKWKVTGQFVLEVFFVALISLVIGTAIGFVSSQPITNQMLKIEIDSYTSKSTSIEENFGRNDMSRPAQDISGGRGGQPNEKSGGKGMTTNTTDYVTSLEVQIDLITILQLFGISILLTITSGGVACIIVNQYNPNKILQNRT